MSQASTDELAALHALIADKMAAKIRSGDFTAADLNVARQFLKDNNITALNIPKSPINSLSNALPFAGSDDKPEHYN